MQKKSLKTAPKNLVLESRVGVCPETALKTRRRRTEAKKQRKATKIVKATGNTVLVV